jgi:hypothetical protein
MSNTPVSELKHFVHATFDQLVADGWRLKSKAAEEVTNGSTVVEVDFGNSKSRADLTFIIREKNAANPDAFLGATFCSEEDSAQSIAERIKRCLLD